MEVLAMTYLISEYGHYTCGICGKILRDRTDGKRHLEAKHFPTDGAYSCNLCGKSMNTVNALKSHKNKCGASAMLNTIIVKNEDQF